MSSSFSLANSPDFNSKLKSFTALKIRNYIRKTPPEIIALYKRDNSDFDSEKNTKNTFQNYFKKNKSKRKSVFSIKQEDNENNNQNKSKILDSVFNTSSLELGSYDAKDEFPKDLIDIIFSKSTVSLVMSKSHFLWRLENNMVQDFMKYTLMTFGVKILGNLDYFKDHIYMAGSTYANKALELLELNHHKVTVDRIFCLMLLSIHFMDTSDNLKSVQLSDEYKRRVFWFVYVYKVSSSLTYGFSSYIEGDMLQIDLPSKDLYYSDHSHDTYQQTSINCQRFIHNNRDKTDEHWLMIKVYLELDLVASYANRIKFDFFKKKKNFHLKREYLNKRIDSYEQLYKSHYSEFLPESDQIYPNEILAKDKMSVKYSVFLYCGVLYRLSRLILNQTDIVNYNLELVHLLKAKHAKSVCIEMALQISALLKWAAGYFSIHFFKNILFFSAIRSLLILLNSLKITDHPKYNVIKSAYPFLLNLFNKFSSISADAYGYKNRAKYNHSVYNKAVESNLEYIESFPELEISQLTKYDNNIWFLNLNTSHTAYQCCSVSIDCPDYKYVFIENWIKSGIIQSRNKKIAKLIKDHDMMREDKNADHLSNNSALNNKKEIFSKKFFYADTENNNTFQPYHHPYPSLPSPPYYSNFLFYT
ncbi:hypothetical protein AYI70_g1856 [Smittium culicis]|uniref:Transcription factor domain-containing protein n=1 Tax=Smittium culicis TaxID=133412 RepID=A0A1R1YB12_9FUNG|nr:hypothetical protein AYI70_g1856 [Smittium culicis]